MTILKLRKIKNSDLSFFLKWWKDQELINLTSGFSEKSDEILTKYFFNIFKSKNDYHFIIMLDRKPIGHIAIIRKSVEIFEIQIVIGEKQYQGKGFGAEAIRKATNIAFKKLGFSKAYLEVRPENIRAIRAYEACGFTKNGFKKYPNNKYQPITLKMVLKK
jgi:RimJ/RimL family protein N-acetyltransferase